MANNIKDAKVSDLIKSFPVKALAWGALPIAFACYLTGDLTKTDLLKNPAFIAGAIAVTTGIASGAYYSVKKDEQVPVVEQPVVNTAIKALPPAPPVINPVQEVEPVREQEETIPRNLTQILEQGQQQQKQGNVIKAQFPKGQLQINPVMERSPARSVVNEIPIRETDSDPWNSNGVM